MIEKEQKGQLNNETDGTQEASPNESEIHPSHKPCRVHALCISPLRGEP